MTDIKLDFKNYRKHGDKNKKLIRQSLEDLGTGRSIVLDNDNVIVAGNGVYEQAKDLGLKVKVIESDGTELIAIKRTDLTTEDEKRKLLAIADNKTSDTSEFDFDLLSSDFDFDILNDLGFDEVDFDSIDILDDLESNSFAKAIKEDSETFDFTLSIPRQFKEDVELYVKSHTKAPLVELILKSIPVCQHVEAK